MIWSNFFMTSIVVAGTAVLWRSLLNNSAWLRNAVKNILPGKIAKAVTCGLCFTYWLALFAVIISDPLRGWVPPWRFAMAVELESLLSFMTSWMAIGFGAVALRFVYVVIQESVNYFTHTLNASHGKTHEH
ncbi:MAG: hypothetical protein AAB407_02535 [Patescibacteria group bacterium]